MDSDAPRIRAVVVLGDSITAPKALTDQVAFLFQVAANRGEEVRVVNASQGGRPAAEAVRLVDSLVLPHAPDAVVVQFGFNDLRHDAASGRRGRPISTPDEFADHLRGIVKQVRAGSRAEVVLIGNHRADSILVLPTGRGYDETRRLYSAEARRVADELGTHFLDMEVEFARGPHPFTAYLIDGVHLSPLGLDYYAAALANRLGAIFDARRTTPEA